MSYQINHTSSLPALAASMVLVIGMGFGRFAFTGVYPIMVAEQILSVAGGTMAATANYLGYLIGALLLMKLPAQWAKAVAVGAVLGTALALIGLAQTTTLFWIIVLRALAGILSAVCMVAGSTWLFAVMGQAHRSPLLYAGVGMGIFLSAECIALGEIGHLSSMGIWYLLGGIALVLGLLSSMVQYRAIPPNHIHHTTTALPINLHHPWQLSAVYGLAGLGYIITATYLPLLMGQALQDFNPIHAWAIFGLGAAPSCFIWHRLHMRLGTRFALISNLTIQAIGVLLPVIGEYVWLYFASALLVGATFMGTVTIVMPVAKHINHQLRFNLLAIITACYGIGQIVGPMIAGGLYQHSGHFNHSLIFAAATLLVAAILCLPQLKESNHALRQH